MKKGCAICHSCGKEVEFALEEPPCKVLGGWLIVSHWKGLESVDGISFAHLPALKGGGIPKSLKSPRCSQKLLRKER